MGCSFSGLNALYDAVNGCGDVWINENRFRIVRQLGEGGFAYVFLVKEVVTDASGGGLAARKLKNPSHVSEDGLYAMKKVTIQTKEQLELVRQEIHVSSLFNHQNVLPLLDHTIIPVKGTQDKLANQEAYILFPVHLDGTLLDNSKVMQSKKEFFPPIDVLQIFRQEWAAEHCSAPFRAPELWDCPSHTDIDERTDYLVTRVYLVCNNVRIYGFFTTLLLFICASSLSPGSLHPFILVLHCLFII